MFAKPFAAAALLASLASPALAQTSTPFNWSGAYAGVQTGILSSDNGLMLANRMIVLPFADVGQNVFTLGLRAGYRHQYANGLTLGVEADYGFSTGSAKNKQFISLNGGGIILERGINQIAADGSLRLTAGYAFGGLLPYVTGGLAVAREVGCSTLSAPVPSNGCGNETDFAKYRVAPTIGAGLAMALSQNVVAAAEYRYADFGRETYVNPSILASRIRSTLQTHAALFSLTYKFGAPSPVAARY
jgi:opacity protein-like surface antigen